MSKHPSRLVLDRARLGDRSADVAAHIETCDVCRNYIASRSVESVPAWVSAIDRPRRDLWWHQLLRPAPVAALAVAAAAVLWLQVEPEPQSPGTYVGVKAATPSVEVFLQRADRVEPWLSQAVMTGDRLQLRIRPEGFAEIAVVAHGPDGFVVLHRQAVDISERASLVSLSRSFRVDGSAADNQLVVVLSRAPLTSATLQTPPTTSSANVWVRWLRFEQDDSHE